QAEVGVRLAALRLLARQPARVPGDLQILAGLLEPQTSPVLQNAALRAIGQVSQERAAKLLLSAWPSASPALRPRMLEALMSRGAWVELLLAAIEKQKLAAGEIPPVFRER